MHDQYNASSLFTVNRQISRVYLRLHNGLVSHRQSKSNRNQFDQGINIASSKLLDETYCFSKD